MIDIVKKSDCTGCKMCGDICPHAAITFLVDADGFWYPEVDYNKCTRCKLCINKCPVNKPYENLNKEKPVVYSAWSKDDKIRVNSTSGGIYYTLAEHVIKDEGYIAGCVYSEDYKSAFHIIGNTMSDLNRIMRSKYFQSDTEGIFRIVKTLLDKKKKVMFCGTPCQVAGLINFLPKIYENLITCDFVCRGINSPKAFKAFIEDLEHIYHSKVSLVHLKNKNHGWTSLGTYVEFENGKKYYKNRIDDPWVNGYINGNLYMRQCCNECKFKKIPRISDISLGDFWGLQSSKNNMFKGISLVMVNSEKGRILFDSIKDKIETQEQTLEKAIEGNGCIINPAPLGLGRNEFFGSLGQENFSDLVWKFVKRSKWKQFAHKIKYYILEAPFHKKGV